MDDDWDADAGNTGSTSGSNTAPKPTPSSGMSFGRGRWFGKENSSEQVNGFSSPAKASEEKPSFNGASNATTGDSGWEESPTPATNDWGNSNDSRSDDRGFGGRGGRGGPRGGRGGFRNDRGGGGGGFRDRDNGFGGGGFKDKDNNGFGGGGGGFRNRDNDGGGRGFGDQDNDGGSRGFGGGGRRGGFGDGDGGGRRGGFGDGDGGGRRGGFGDRGGRRGGRDNDGGGRGFGDRDNSGGGGFGNRDNDSGGFGKRDNDGGGFGRRDNDGGGFGSRDNDGGGGFQRREFNGDSSDSRGERGRGRGRGRGGGGGFRSNDDGDDEEGTSGGGFRRGGMSNRGGRGGFRNSEDGQGDREGEDGGDGGGEDERPKVPMYVPPAPPEDEETIFAGIPSGINFSKYENIPVKVTGSNPPRPIQSFAESGLRNLLLENIRKSNYTVPTPVQKYSIPIVMADRDVMTCAQTGSGKTAAFLLPIFHNLMDGDVESASFKPVQEPYVIIISPTRELAVQIYMEARKFSLGSIIKSTIVYGGVSSGHQLRNLESGCHVLVATPGRLLDFTNRGKISFAKIRYLVLDEADRMLDMGFIPDIQKMVNHSTMPPKKDRRTLMYSATFPEEVQKLAREYLDDYLFLAVGMVGGANSDVEQKFYKTTQYEKREKLLNILVHGERVMVFLERKRNADFLASYLCQNELMATSIHGDRFQQQREEALYDFKSGKMPVLVATSVASRGLDIKDVAHVVNYDLPQTIEEYVHRIGRTGRVGNLGKATSFFDPTTDQALARSLVKVLADANQEVPDWLEEEAKSAGGYSSSGFGRGRFGGSDIRSNKEIRGGSDGNDDHWNNTAGGGGDGQSSGQNMDEESWD